MNISQTFLLQSRDRSGVADDAFQILALNFYP